MTTSSTGERRALVRALVAEFAPEELPDFDTMTAAYFAAPAAARRARRTRDEPGAFGIDLGDPTFTNLMWGVIGGLTTEAIVLGVRGGRARLRRWFGSRPTPGPQDPLPEAPPDSGQAARAEIADVLKRAGRADADEISERVVDRWSRRDWTPPA
ncbi:hypothetical protein [Streptosporangium sp. NPDC002524]|uniref:hypothetical protein n=1 Tax=Streptosporangium sp. NPDC002524 TaxID=3154537 RepID=UPI00332EC657